KSHGFNRLTLAVGYLAELIKAYFQDGSRWGVQIDYSHEAEPLGTAGPLALIDNLDETFLVMNADVISNIDFNILLQYHCDLGSIATIGAFQREVKIDLGVIVGDSHNRIKDYIEKPTHSYLVSMGVYVFEPEILQFISGKGYLDFPDLVKLLLDAGLPVYYYPFSGYWLDIGRHEDYAKAANEFSEIFPHLHISQ
ncbi:MAG: sugar phosphate nucleotidyltransferase, partial [Candidatus Subteraquimicrobiales bacterium]|nr:sugar phosphate nucleotidyltransferase [Candidatus Subteraquimicrobiales bacterium]